MSGFEKKYGITETQRIKEFHKGRRMFAIYKGRLYIADKGLDYSHAEWFMRMDWISESDDSIMGEVVRGYVKDGAIFFYIGYDFSINETAIEIMRNHIAQLTTELGLNQSTLVRGGVILNEDGSATERLNLGTLSDFVG
jgi:hypothetical protein